MRPCRAAAGGSAGRLELTGVVALAKSSALFFSRSARAKAVAWPLVPNETPFGMITPASLDALRAYALRARHGGPSRPALGPHLRTLEAESITILRETAAEFRAPVVLYSIGKDSTVLLHLALKAFWPHLPPFAFLHIDSLWEFKEMAPFRDALFEALGLSITVHVNEDGKRARINPFEHGQALFTDVMRTQGLLQALSAGRYDAAIGGARRDEERSRAKERIFSVRNSQAGWDPRRQRPEMWHVFNTRLRSGDTMRVFPLSNWTEADVWLYIEAEDIPVAPLYFAAPRPVVERDGALLMVDDERMPLRPGETPEIAMVRFRTLGCYPLTGGVRSLAQTPAEVALEMVTARTSERSGRLIDHDEATSMEKKKKEGYF
jgi:sulfate adenylyltransferase subunit 2